MPVWLIPLIFQLLQYLPGLIKTAEVAFSGAPGKSGAAKKQLVMNSVAAAVDLMATVSPDSTVAANKPAIMNTVSVLTDSTVAVLNTVKALQNPVADAGGPNEK